MAGVLEYKGYHGSIEVSVEDGLLYGRVVDVADLVSYEGGTVAEIEASFRQAIDDYLRICEEAGQVPDKPFSGTFNVRIDKVLHRRAACAATSQGVTLNQFVALAIESAVENDVSAIVTAVRTEMQASRFLVMQRFEDDVEEVVYPWSDENGQQAAHH